MNYTKKEIRELSELYNININTLLSQQKKGKQAVDLIIIKRIATDKKLTLEQFLKLFEEKTLTDKIKELSKKPYSSTLPLELAMLEHENENGYFIDEQLYENRRLIAKIRKDWWGV